MDFTSIKPILAEAKPLESRELERALRLSISAEHDAAHLYEAIADSTKNEKIKALFQDIANEEKVHVGEFEQLLNTLDKKNEKLVEEGRVEAMKKVSRLSIEESNKAADALKKVIDRITKQKPMSIGDAARLGAMNMKKPGVMEKMSSFVQEAFEEELQKIAFMTIEDLEDEELGTHVKGRALTELALQLLEKEKQNSFALRHPLITGLPTMGMWPLIKEQYALHRVGRKLMREDDDLANRVEAARENNHRRQVEYDSANQLRNTAAELVSGYLAGKGAIRE